MKFPAGNVILYSRDRLIGVFCGVPSDIDFEVTRFGIMSFALHSPGNGGDPWGDGPLRLLGSDIDPALARVLGAEVKEVPR